MDNSTIANGVHAFEANSCNRECYVAQRAELQRYRYHDLLVTGQFVGQPVGCLLAPL